MSGGIYAPGPGEAVRLDPLLDPLRLGKLTASMAGVMMGGLKTQGLDDYVKDIAWERVHGPRDPGYKSLWMERGHVVEPLAREWYEFRSDVAVDVPGFVTHPTIDYVGCTPDGLRPDRTVQIKSPGHRAWMEVKLSRDVPSVYRWQCRWEMWATSLWACDFVVYHPLSGGIVIPFALEDSDVKEMTERAAYVNERVEQWVAILRQKDRASVAPEAPAKRRMH